MCQKSKSVKSQPVLELEKKSVSGEAGLWPLWGGAQSQMHPVRKGVLSIGEVSHSPLRDSRTLWFQGKGCHRFQKSDNLLSHMAKVNFYTQLLEIVGCVGCCAWAPEAGMTAGPTFTPAGVMGMWVCYFGDFTRDGADSPGSTLMGQGWGRSSCPAEGRSAGAARGAHRAPMPAIPAGNLASGAGAFLSNPKCRSPWQWTRKSPRRELPFPHWRAAPAWAHLGPFGLPLPAWSLGPSPGLQSSAE